MFDFVESWPYLFSGVLGVTVASLMTWGIYVRERHRKNVELIASSFPNVINFSYNFMEDGILRFRTLFETTIDEIAQSPELERMMQIAADNCAGADAFFSEPDPEPDTCYNRIKRRIWPTVEWRQVLELLHLSILNSLSARYSEGHFGHALIGLTTPGPTPGTTGPRKHQNMTIVTENFCFGLTCEKNEAVRARKIRVMIAAKDFLKHQVVENAPPPEFERKGHFVRWETMLQMKRHMEREEEAAAMNKKFCRKVWEVSLSFIVPRAPEDSCDLQDRMLTICDQLQAMEGFIKSGRVSCLPPHSRGTCSWRAGGEEDGEQNTGCYEGKMSTTDENAKLLLHGEDSVEPETTLVRSETMPLIVGAAKTTGCPQLQRQTTADSQGPPFGGAVMKVRSAMPTGSPAIMNKGVQHRK